MRFKIRFKAKLAAFAAFFATIPIYSPNVVTFTSSLDVPSESIGWFVNPLLFSALVTGAALALLSLNRPLEKRLFSLPSIVGSTALYLCGFALMAFDALGSPPLLASLEIAAGVACGIGLIPLCIAWGALFASMDIRRALFHLAVFCGIGSIVAFMLSSLSGFALLVSYGLMLVIGVAVPIVKTCAKSIGSDPDTEAEEEELPAKQGSETVVQTFRRLASVAAAPFIGFIVFAFTMSARKFNLFGVYDIEVFAGMIAPLIVIPFCFARIKRPFFSFIYQMLLPVCALALIVFNSFPLDTVPQWIGAATVYVFFAMLGLLALAALCAVAHAREFPPTLVFGGTLAAFSAVSLIGIQVGQAVAEDILGPALLVISTLYFVGLILAALVSLSRSRDEQQASTVAAVPVEEFLKLRCEEIARESALSPREAEILLYMGRGHNPVFIAKTLVLSVSTVRTHIRNIYRKVEVSSREELLALIDSTVA
ncbi:helix-turn-helix transcriptional regulator [Raoultibacter phocaeensis]|uniref:helix-turn-helix transcriptional regulator n=1 Tax=Raoultibacter phocaeensis TaxID=2479841 RepID=UPI00111827DF|nr:helix-turn-helix transcriptional regulator [Raoultibacter phocaeensis]